MALPHLIKYIYNNGTDEVIRRGKKIHAIGNVELVEYDDLTGSVIFRVKDDSYSTYYKVYVSKFKDQKDVSIRCGCPYNLGEICRHEAAALFHLQDMVDRNMLGEKEVQYDQRHTVIKMKQLELKMIKLLTAPGNLKDAEEFLRGAHANILSAKDERVDAELVYDKTKYDVVIQKNEERNFDTSCPCNSETRHPLCLHKTIVLLQLLHAFGPNYFDTIRNLDKEKNKLLAIYGFSLDDDLKGKFEFIIKEGKPFLKVLDPSIKRIVTAPSYNAPRLAPMEAAPAEIPEKEEKTVSAVKLGVVIVNNPHQYPFVQLDAVQGDTNDDQTSFAGKTEKLDLGKYVNTEILDEGDKSVVQQLRKLLPGEVSRYLNRNSPF
ncbi:MAG: box helicase, partial [Chitinophagaceae bacterium]|nr:box helicase [Chitinophagaceae bacterium]